MSVLTTEATHRTDTTLPTVVGAETTVPVLDGRRLRYANFDGAASAPALTAVADRVAEILPWYASVHRGAGYLSQVSTALYEAARTEIGRFVGARNDDTVIIVRNTTDAVNLLASVTPGRTLVLDLEHHANLLPWQRSAGGATVLPVRETLADTLAAIYAELGSRRYALLAVTGASNVTGEIVPLAEVTTLAHRHGTRVFVDGAQLLAHRRIDLAESGVDAVAFSGHKLYAPYGAGALVARGDWLDAGDPYLAGGGAVRRVRPGTTDAGAIGEVEWATGAARHEAGSPNVIGAVALGTACAELAALGARTAEHERRLHGRLLDGLAALPEVQVARLWPDAPDATATVTFTLGTDPGLLAAYLSAEHAIGVRDGRFCAHPLLERLDRPEGAVRVGIGLQSRSDDIERLLAALVSYDETHARSRYAVVDGCWTTAHDPRPLPEVTRGLGLAATAAVYGADR